MLKLLLAAFLFASSSAFAFEEPINPSLPFVPAQCQVESWCVISATDCTFGHYTHPQGLWQARAQYSVVRKAVAVCPSGGYYGPSERRQIMGPVEPAVFVSEVMTRDEPAREQALQLCATYRADWVAAAPRCK